MKLTSKAKKAITEKPHIFNILALEFEKAESTTRRWLKTDSEMLTTVKALKIIAKETGLNQSEIISK